MFSQCSDKKEEEEKVSLVAETELSCIYSKKDLAYKIYKDPDNGWLVDNAVSLCSLVSSERLIKVHGLVEVGTLKALVSDLYESDLFAASVSYKEKVSLFKDLCLGVRDLHACGVCHNDIKPSNVFIKKGRAYLGDLDFCTFEKKEAVDDVMTTYAYASPETYPKGLKDGGVYTRAGDIWSLGCVLYFLLEGCHLFPSSIEEHHKFFTDRKNMEDIFRPFGNNALYSLLKKLLELDPAKRLTIKEVLEEIK